MRFEMNKPGICRALHSNRTRFPSRPFYAAQKQDCLSRVSLWTFSSCWLQQRSQLAFLWPAFALAAVATCALRLCSKALASLGVSMKCMSLWAIIAYRGVPSLSGLHCSQGGMHLHWLEWYWLLKQPACSANLLQHDQHLVRTYHAVLWLPMQGCDSCIHMQGLLNQIYNQHVQG